MYKKKCWNLRRLHIIYFPLARLSHKVIDTLCQNFTNTFPRQLLMTTPRWFSTERRSSFLCIGIITPPPHSVGKSPSLIIVLKRGVLSMRDADFIKSLDMSSRYVAFPDFSSFITPFSSSFKIRMLRSRFGIETPSIAGKLELTYSANCEFGFATMECRRRQLKCLNHSHGQCMSNYSPADVKGTSNLPRSFGCRIFINLLNGSVYIPERVSWPCLLPFYISVFQSNNFDVGLYLTGCLGIGDLIFCKSALLIGVHGNTEFLVSIYWVFDPWFCVEIHYVLCVVMSMLISWRPLCWSDIQYCRIARACP